MMEVLYFLLAWVSRDSDGALLSCININFQPESVDCVSTGRVASGLMMSTPLLSARCVEIGETSSITRRHHPLCDAKRYAHLRTPVDRQSQPASTSFMIHR